jgi:hypothetical protein
MNQTQEFNSVNHFIDLFSSFQDVKDDVVQENQNQQKNDNNN